jgi:hypothetical protein
MGRLTKPCTPQRLSLLLRARAIEDEVGVIKESASERVLWVRCVESEDVKLVLCREHAPDRVRGQLVASLLAQAGFNCEAEVAA